MIETIIALKRATRTFKPLPYEFSSFASRQSPSEKLNRIYSSPQLHSQLQHKAVQNVVFSVPPAAPPRLLQHAPQATYMAIRSYLIERDLNAAFDALEYVPRQTKKYHYLPLVSLGFVSLLVWQNPLGLLIGFFWSGLAITSRVSPKYQFVQWRSSVPQSLRDSNKIATCDHIVAWYEDYIGVTTENWHRKHVQKHIVSEQTLTRLLAEQGLERAPRLVDYEFADYWSHRDGFDWQEPDQDPAYFEKWKATKHNKKRSF